jgi:phosphopantothenoylcysteine decarboxylase/phosphopantothenate--cysteine ligase
MGFELARAFAAHGAQVTLVAGPVTRRTPVGVVARTDVVTAAEMGAAVDALWPTTDVLVMAAAVADFRPREPSARKLKKRATTDDAPTLPLARTDDILLGAARRPDRARVALVGFAAETHDVLAYAQAKRAEKDLDWIVANDVSDPSIGFGIGDNAGWLVARDGTPTALARAPKAEFADAVVAHIAPALAARFGPTRRA